MLFQSTPSVKRVTLTRKLVNGLMAISIHTLCEEGDALNTVESYTGADISIHTLCEEGDDEGQCSAIFFDISIHTLCEEGDQTV